MIKNIRSYKRKPADLCFMIFFRKIPCLTFVLSLFTVLLSVHSQSEFLYSQDVEDRNIQTYIQAVNEIEKKALRSQPRKEIIKNTLKSYLKTLDEFSDYLSADEYAAFQKSQSGQYVGLGMEIEKNSSGQFICFPYPDSPAHKAGIRSGDILESLADEDISDKSIYQIASRAMGEKGTKVSAKIRNADGNSRIVQIIRDKIVSKSVQIRKEKGMTVIEIFYFGGTTVRELKFVLTEIKDHAPLILDLRKNPGGDLHSAIDSAMLFLEKGKKILEIQSRDRAGSYHSTAEPMNTFSPLYLWQDSYTASAAEVFAAALVQNRRAESVGKRTFGKGVQQDIIELTDGSALFLTTAYLQTPNGTLYHGQGLDPTHMIQEISPDTDSYMKKVKSLADSKSERKILSADHNSESKPDENKITPDTNPVSIPAVEGGKEKTSANVYFNCFSREFDTEEDAEIWSDNILSSLNNPDEYYLFQQNSSGSIKYIICLGIYESKEEAQQKLRQVSGVMKADMFIKSVKK